MLVLKLFFLAIISNVSAYKFTYNLTLPVETAKAFNYPKDSYLYFTEKVAEHGYEAAEYTVQTEDGYLLKMFEMKSPKCETYKEVPVFLIHGLLSNADVYIVAGPGAAIAYLLADDCYRVFLGNHRGTNHGRRHITLNPDEDTEFWDFSVTEYGKYDTPAFIDSVLEITGAEQLHYIGYSQGGIVFLVALSTRPEYNDKIKSAVLLAPGKNGHYSKLPAMAAMAKLVSTFKGVLDTLGIYEILFKGSIIQVLFQHICHDLTFTKPFCKQVAAALDSYDEDVSDYTLQNFFSVFAMGASTKLAAHYHQLIKPNTFKDYDYGTVGNMLKYKSLTPPDFNTDNIDVKTTLIVSTGDLVFTVEEGEEIKSFIKDCSIVVMDNDKWNHGDHVLSPVIADNTYGVIKQVFEEV